MKAYLYELDGDGKGKETEIPANLQEPLKPPMSAGGNGG